MTLPASEIERIEATADAIFNPKDLPICTPEIAHHLGELCSAFIAGATSEAIRGREMGTGFAEWIPKEQLCLDLENGKWYKRPITQGCQPIANTTAELLDLYILDTQKRKG